METIQSHDGVSTKQTHSMVRVVLGVLFLLPALFCCLSQLFLPTISTFLMSFQNVRPFGAETVYVGMANYAALFENAGFGRAAGFTLTTILVRLLVVALVPLCLAWAASQLGRFPRLGLRILFTLPIVLFAPVVIAVTWLMALNPLNGLLPLGKSWAASPASARSTLLLIDALYLFGLASGLGLMVYLPLWRRSADTSQPTFSEVTKPMLAILVFSSLGVIVWTLSTFTLSLVMTRGGPVGGTSTLGMLLYQFAFLHFKMGPAAAIASLILLVTLVLGIAAGLLVVLTRLRLDLVDTEPALDKTVEPVSSTRSQILPGILVLLALVICLFSALPFGWLIPQAFGEDGSGRLFEQISTARVFINTFLPPLITATWQILLAYLAALSIGALRPIGKHSEWLLLLFSPWLFISVLPLSLVNFVAAQKAGLLDTFLGSLSPIQFSVPALFILTIFFSGRVSRLQNETIEGTAQKTANFFKHFILPSLPLAAVLWLVLLFFNGQDGLWTLLVSNSPERYNLNITLLRLVGMYNGTGKMLAAVITFFILPGCVFFFLCLAPFQIFYLDRLTLYAEDPATGEAVQTLE